MILQEIASKWLITLSFILASIFTSFSSQATIVQLETKFGPIQINLYDQATPVTVANFLAYLNDGDYTNTFIHRSVAGFVIQGGGFTFDTNWIEVDSIESKGEITNEPLYSNIRGTIAMARSSGVNSATSQWYINLSNNSLALDNQNEGFTVFGEVIDSGLDVVDQIAAIETFSDGSFFTEIPLDDYDGASDPDENNVIIISAINITDPTVDSAAGLNPALAIDPPVAEPPAAQPSGSSGGGSFGFFCLFLAMLGFRKRT